MSSPLPYFRDFYPRPPWGGRPGTGGGVTYYQMSFLSTPSVGRATAVRFKAQRNVVISIHALRGEGDGGERGKASERQAISIHALRGEGDAAAWRHPARCANFYPRPPWGGRRFVASGLRIRENFYPRPPWGGRQAYCLMVLALSLFLSTPSVGRATLIGGKGSVNYVDFYPRPPWGGRPLCKLKPLRRQTISIHALRGEGDGKCRKS